MGMDKWYNRKATRLPGYDYSEAGAYFLTICTQDHRCILSYIVGTGVPDGPNHITSVGTGVPDGPQIRLTTYGKIADKYIRQISEFYDYLSVADYVIMPNHIHILLRVYEQTEGPSGRPVPTAQNSIVSRFVSTFKRFCNKEYGKNIWQPRSYDHIIRDQKDFDRHLKYIYENPFGWQKDELYTEPEPPM